MSISVVAELGVNHGGDPGRAYEMIEAAARAGCTGVKIQTYRWQDFVAPDHPMRELFEQCEIWGEIRGLSKAAHRCDLLFGTTPTSLEGVQEAVDAGCDFLKNGSDFLLRHDLIQAMLDTGLPTWVSTGMATAEEIVRVSTRAKLMLCTSLYPCPDEEANLDRLRDGWFAGFSDHTEETIAAVIAAAHGVEMIEKHFTLSKNADGPDHAFSADPQEMARLIRDVRRAETMVGYRPVGYTSAEQENRDRWRVTKGTVRTG